MPALMERTVSLDRLLAQRADHKLRQYGWNFDEAVTRALLAIVTVSGAPDAAFAVPISSERRQPGRLRGRVTIASDFDSSSDELADLFESSSV